MTPKRRERPLVSYFRVSTQRQGRSGLGLEAQRRAVEEYVKENGGKIVREFTEVESGKKSDRPELSKAISHTLRSKGTLVVAKLDRLSRNVAFLATLMESGVDFVACDNPHATKFTVHILAAVAEYEREAISKRTKEALASAKRRGKKLGSARPGHWSDPKRQKARKAGGLKGSRIAARQCRRLAVEAYRQEIPLVRRYRKQGRTLQEIADVFNREGRLTRGGGPFYPATIAKIIKYAEDPDPED